MDPEKKLDIFYILNSRFPTIKAYGLQVAKTCEGFKKNGARVRLIIPIRKRHKEIKGIDTFDLYGIKEKFRLIKLPSLDVAWIGLNTKIFFAIQQGTFALLTLIYLIGKKGTIYSRDNFSLYFLSFVRKNIYWEVHQFPEHIHSFMYKRLLAHVSGIVVITEGLKKKFLEHGIPEAKILVAHDGVDLEEFTIMNSQGQCRDELRLPRDKKIIGYVGQLRTLGMDKGINALIEACDLLRKKRFDCLMVIVGGDEQDLEFYKKEAADRHIPETELLFTGRKEHRLIPKYLKAFDVTTMPFPYNDHFAFYMSPLKLFEYMASGRPIIASDLPSVREVLNDNNAFLTQPGSVEQLVQAIEHAVDFPDQAVVRAQKALIDIRHYTWVKRCDKIIQFIKHNL